MFSSVLSLNVLSMITGSTTLILLITRFYSLVFLFPVEILKFKKFTSCTHSIMYRYTFFKAADHCRATLSNIVLKRNAGHNKWSNIKHIKGANDQQKSLLFARFSRQMKLAIRGNICIQLLAFQFRLWLGYQYAISLMIMFCQTVCLTQINYIFILLLKYQCIIQYILINYYYTYYTFTLSIYKLI